MKTTSMVFAIAGFVLLCSPNADAQGAAPAGVDRPVFLDVNVGVEGAPNAVQTSSSFPLFGEVGAAATRQEPGASAIIDVRAGYRVSGRLGVALAVSGTQSESVGRAAASLPSPIRFASPSVVNFDTPGLKRRELGYHLQAVWFMPVRGNVMLAIFGGPSFVHLQQGLISVSIATGTQTASLNVTNESGTATGGHIGVDITRPFSSRLGAGIFIRYVAASLDLPSAAGMKAGGVQGGVGVRVRF